MIVYYAFFTLILPWLFFREHNKKNTCARKAIYNNPPPKNPVVWCHGASIGECSALLPVVKEISEKFPHTHIVLTHQTVGAIQAVQSKLPPQVLMHYLPFDHPKYVNRFLDHWNPRCIFWIESEFWPGFFTAIQKRNIPAYLLNGRLSHKSYKVWSYFSWIARYILSVFKEIYVSTPHDVEKFSSLLRCPTYFVGNLKAYTPLPIVDKTSKDALISQINGRPFFLAANTHPGEEGIVLSAFTNLKKTQKDLLLILVPRKPERAEEIISTAGKKYTWEQRSKNNKITEKTDIYIADTFGELGTFFSISNIVIMGGSIKDYGGHNIMEPATCSCAIISGPFVENNKEIYEDFLHKKGCLLVTKDTLEKTIKILLGDYTKVSHLQHQAQEIAHQQMNTKNNYMKIIERIVKHALHST